MLDDRSYMKSVSFGPSWPVTKALLLANAALFVLQTMLEKWSEVPMEEVFYLSKQGLADGYLFQLISYQFLHGGLWHLLGNLLVIYFFGKEMEKVLGRKDFLMLYFAGGIAGGLFQVALALAMPAFFDGCLVGASAATFGLVAAFAMMFPNRQIVLLVFFVLPVSFRARTLLWIAFALAIFGVLLQPESHIAHGAHLGGLCAGAGFVYCFVRNRWRFRLPSFSRLWPQKIGVRRGGKPWRNARAASAGKPGNADFISQEIDPILDKISEQGIHSLTKEERQLLESARSRMGRR